ncbi:nuclear transport factor 2 family protein [uncultured Winogradskyella sp.]|uniref:nuclear transport factor 2 family protein n=1 Tax=uncultured Winogradskyella sp. TaxID=395353 RepID=UPI00261FC149|nr:nuclear transport factor 2 family protein [uncultured Winogradskyella sp.]
MPTSNRVEEFIAKVETNEHDKAIEEFYAIDASIQENQSEPRIGRSNLIDNERKVLSKAKSVHSKCIRPVFIKENHVVIRWKFKFTWLDNSVTEIEEIAVQHWENEYILEEKFYFDPIQMKPKKQ